MIWIIQRTKDARGRQNKLIIIMLHGVMHNMRLKLNNNIDN